MAGCCFYSFIYCCLVNVLFQFVLFSILSIKKGVNRFVFVLSISVAGAAAIAVNAIDESKRTQNDLGCTCICVCLHDDHW